MGESGPRPRAAILPFPGIGADPRRLTSYLRSTRSLLAAAALVALAAGGYAAARETSAFAVRTIEVEGAPAPVAAELRAALRELRGQSLVTLPGARVERLAERVPRVGAVSYDRAFPYTLVVFVVPERPVAVLRRGATSWLVSARGRVLERLPLGARPNLPRIWLRDGVLERGRYVTDPAPLRALRALAPATGAAFAPRIRTVRFGPRELTFELAAGGEVRLGNESDLALKLAVAARILRPDDGGTDALEYLDVSVPARPVSRIKSQPEG